MKRKASKWVPKHEARVIYAWDAISLQKQVVFWAKRGFRVVRRDQHGPAHENRRGPLLRAHLERTYLKGLGKKKPAKAQPYQRSHVNATRRAAKVAQKGKREQTT